MWYDNPYTIVATATAATTASSFCWTVLFFQRLLQVRPSPHGSKEEHLENAGARLLYRSYALPVIQTTV